VAPALTWARPTIILHKKSLWIYPEILRRTRIGAAFLFWTLHLRLRTAIANGEWVINTKLIENDSSLWTYTFIWNKALTFMPNSNHIFNRNISYEGYQCVWVQWKSYNPAD
jgi:hypothetical protein